MSEEFYGPDLLTLVDDANEEHTFEVLDTLEEDDGKYIALLPYYGDSEEYVESDGELVILKADLMDGDEEESYIAIEDEDEINRVADIFMERLSDEFDFDTEDK